MGTGLAAQGMFDDGQQSPAARWLLDVAYDVGNVGAVATAQNDGREEDIGRSLATSQVQGQ
ncbi:MAG: hypothetical protein ACUVTY_09585 [Armatimonadota bacterium]